jgi:hypothetical protein
VVKSEEKIMITRKQLDKAHDLRMRCYEIHHAHILKLVGKRKRKMYVEFYYKDLDRLDKWYENMKALIEPKKYKKFLDHLEESMNKI